MKQSLIVDSGSTKTQWVASDTAESYITPGINPVHLDDDALVVELLKASEALPSTDISAIAWYGAGCGSELHCIRMRTALKNIFGSDVKVTVGSDLLCAARATAGNSPGIVCILGTGSNSGVYDGHDIIDNIPPLGYILGDEGSGAAIGKRLVNAVLKRALPIDITQTMVSNYNITRDAVQQAVYREATPNRYLATFAKVAAENIAVPEIRALVAAEIDLFLTNNVLRYSQSRQLPVHFVGGAAYIFKSIIEELLSKHHLQQGMIVRSPLDAEGDLDRFLD